MSIFDQLIEDIESDHEEWEARGRDLAARRVKIKELGDRALDAHEARYDTAEAAFRKMEETAKRLQGNQPPPEKKVADSGNGSSPKSEQKPSEEQTITADQVGKVEDVLKPQEGTGIPPAPTFP